MNKYLLRRLLISIPTFFAISVAIFLLLALSPGDPTSNLPPEIPQQVRERIRQSLGLGQPLHIRYIKWMEQFFINEPLNFIEKTFDITIGNSEERLRVTSWSSRGKPVVDLISERLPQTLWVVGLSQVISILIAIPLGIVSAVKRGSIIAHISTVLSVIGFSMPIFVTGTLAIVVFSVHLKWFPMLYDTTLKVTDGASFIAQLRQMVMPVTVLVIFQTATMSRFVRASTLEELAKDYGRTARAKGFSERYVILRHLFRNAMIPVITLITLGIPGIFGGAIISEQIFRVNGMGALLITSIQSYDIPVLMTTTIIFAMLVLGSNFLADVLYGVLDPRIRYQ
ncbi:MAG: ABC transporter permease [Desulfobacterales bacterium]|jgi:peptide/nickel transport system permease protein